VVVVGCFLRRRGWKCFDYWGGGRHSCPEFWVIGKRDVPNPATTAPYRQSLLPIIVGGRLIAKMGCLCGKWAR